MRPEDLDALIAEVERRETLKIARLLAIVELRERGMSFHAIGRVLGLSHTHVRRISGTFEVPRGDGVE